MEFTIKHNGAAARYGVDECGPWAEIVWNGLVVRHDANEPDFEQCQPWRSVLLFLAIFEFLDCSSDEIDAALDWLDRRNSHGENFSPGWPCRRRQPPRRLRRVLRVISDLRAAGG